MLSCESCQNAMADALYHSPPEQFDSGLREHLAACPACDSLYRELQAAAVSLQEAGVASANFDDIPERAALDGLWHRLEPSLNQIDAERYQRMAKPSPAPWAAAITALAASLFLFFAITQPAPELATPQPQRVAETGISPELMNYLDRAQVMLMQVANTESRDVSSIPVTRDFARNLASEANILNVERDSGFSSNQRKLLRDIEFLLVQIANLDENNMEEGVALLQRYLEENSILFQIRLLEMRDQELVI